MAGKAFWVGLLLVSATASIRGEDWPEWRGKGRHGVWSETNILDTFPAGGLQVRWRVPIGSGFSGPAVAGGRVFVTDFVRRQDTHGVERVLCLNERTGAKLWSQEWEADYIGLMDTFATGPRATPTVDQARVYVLGAKGKLLCLDAGTGGIIWQRDYRQDFRTEVPIWGMTGAPLVDGDKLICLVGGQPNAKVVAFDKTNGKELWRALPSDSEPGYSPPFHVTVGGQRQVIIWHPRAVSSLDPDTGRLFWEVPFKVQLSIATPVQSRRYLLVSSFYNGSLLLELDDQRPAAKVVWKGQSQTEINTDGLHSAIVTPAILGDSIYGICSYGQFRCLDLRTGKRLWETLEITGEKARWASGFLVRNRERFFINNDHGELIIAKLSPQGCQQMARTQLIKPTSQPNSRRQGVAAVNWSHPAYANQHIFARNDEEILCASLEKN